MARDAASVQIEHDALWVTIVDNVKSQQQAVSNRQWLEMQHPYRYRQWLEIEHDVLWATIVDNVKSHDVLWATIVDNVKSKQQAASNRQWLEMQHPYR